MRACLRAAASSMRILGRPVSMALAMPPRALDFLNQLPGRVHQLVRQRSRRNSEPAQGSTTLVMPVSSCK